MSVTANRTGNTATVTITIDVADIVAAVGLSNPEKRLAGLRRAAQELDRAIEAHQNTDENLDATVTVLQAKVAATKAARATGSL